MERRKRQRCADAAERKLSRTIWSSAAGAEQCASRSATARGPDGAPTTTWSGE
jgi:hypothetical protein